MTQRIQLGERMLSLRSVQCAGMPSGHARNLGTGGPLHASRSAPGAQTIGHRYPTCVYAELWLGSTLAADREVVARR